MTTGLNKKERAHNGILARYREQGNTFLKPHAEFTHLFEMGSSFLALFESFLRIASIVERFLLTLHRQNFSSLGEDKLLLKDVRDEVF